MTYDEDVLKNIAETVAESVFNDENDNEKEHEHSETCYCSSSSSLAPSKFSSSFLPKMNQIWESSSDFGSFFPKSFPCVPIKDMNLTSEQRNAKRPEWQRLCVQYGVCIHYIYGNCVYEDQCFYKHVHTFTKTQLLYKTETCRYGVNCSNRQTCLFAHTMNEKRTPEQNTFEYFSQNPIQKASPSPLSSSSSSSTSVPTRSFVDSSPLPSPLCSPISSPTPFSHQQKQIPLNSLNNYQNKWIGFNNNNNSGNNNPPPPQYFNQNANEENYFGRFSPKFINSSYFD